jgi:hypothetical protein
MINWLRKDNWRWAKVIGISLLLIFLLAEDYWWHIYLGNPWE